MNTSKRSRYVYEGSDGGDKTLPPRRKPHCRTCGQPMLGHKRDQCLILSIQSLAAEQEEANGMSTWLQGLHIADIEERIISENEPMQTPITIPLRTDSLASFISRDNAMLSVLAKPCIFTDVPSAEDRKAARIRIEKWLKTFPSSKLINTHQKCSSSLTPLLPGSNTIRVWCNAWHIRDESPDAAGLCDFREIIDALGENSKGPIPGVYAMPISLIREVEGKIQSLKLYYSKIIAPRSTNDTIGQDWIVVGNDRIAVENMVDGIGIDAKAVSSLLGEALLRGVMNGVVLVLFVYS